MKKLLPLFTGLVLFLAFGCNPAQDQPNKEEEIRQIENVLEQYVVANENQDFSIIENIWGKDEDIILIGTESDEKLIGWNQIKEAIQHQFQAFENTYISVTEQHIVINETCNTAWFSEELSYNFIYKGEALSYEGIRFTGVLQKYMGRWEIAQGHLSVPAEAVIAKE